MTGSHWETRNAPQLAWSLCSVFLTCFSFLYELLVSAVETAARHSMAE